MADFYWRAGFDQFVDIGPKDLIFRVFEIPKVILFDGEDEEADTGQPHDDGGGNRYPGGFSAVQGWAGPCTRCTIVVRFVISSLVGGNAGFHARVAREGAVLIQDNSAGALDFEDRGSRFNLRWIEFAAAVGGFLPGAVDGLLAGEFGLGESALGKTCFA